MVGGHKSVGVHSSSPPPTASHKENEMQIIIKKRSADKRDVMIRPGRKSGLPPVVRTDVDKGDVPNVIEELQAEVAAAKAAKIG